MLTTLGSAVRQVLVIESSIVAQQRRSGGARQGLIKGAVRFLSRTRFKACVGTMRWKWFRRQHDQPWEVVGCDTVQPVFMFYETGGCASRDRRGAPSHYSFSPEVDIVRVGAYDTCRKYIFDFKRHVPDGNQCTKALLFSQQQLLQEVAKKHYNVLLKEG
ncbi:hypothetical protein JVU11DRAFT_5455 [Chiua virens]|nr:hypothetical protein JVU11DRAFT_5455 [Chiua virens]